jgi:hypothetical protein
MPRRPRLATAGLIFHIVNRAARKAGIFDTWADYQAFEGILVKAIHQGDVEVFAYCVMPNHWHLLISPRSDEALSRLANWRGRPLTDYEVVIETIAATTTDTGLTVQAVLDPHEYPTGVKISKAEFDAVPITRHPFHGEWNYTIVPRTTNTTRNDQQDPAQS